MRLSRRSITTIIFAVTSIILLSACTALAEQPLGGNESKMGAETAKEIEKTIRLIDDETILNRVRTIGEKISSVANKTEIASTYGASTITPFDYTFKVVDDDKINAFSIPGGYIYINKGLISFCESDDEIAAVLAHEIAHAAHHHTTFLLREQSRVDGQLALIALISLIGRTKAEDMSNILTGAQCYRISATSTFTDKAERDADMTALYYLIKAGYNPIGELTFLERLSEKPEVVEWGIFEDHPKAAERARLIKTKLIELGIPIKRSAVSTSCAAIVRKEQPQGITEVLFGGKILCKVASEQKAKDFAESINNIMDEKISLHRIKLCDSTIELSDAPILQFTKEDEDALGKPRCELAAETFEILRRAIYTQMIRELW